MREQGDGVEGARAREAAAKVEASLAGERALVEGRRPFAGEAVVFDETAAKAADGGSAEKVRPKGRIGRAGHDRGRQRLRRKLGPGRKRPGREVKRARSIDRGSARTARHHAHRRDRGNPGARVIADCGKAEAEGSPSSEASPGSSSSAIGRGWARVAAAPSAREGREAQRRTHPGIGQSVGCSGRSSVAEVGATHLSPTVRRAVAAGQPTAHRARRRQGIA